MNPAFQREKLAKLRDLMIKGITYRRKYGWKAFGRKVNERYIVPAVTGEHPSINVVNHIRHMIAPLNLDVSGEAVARVNVLISIIEFKYFFGGYLGMFNLARQLAREGYRVRMIVVEECRYEPEVWREEIKKYEGLEDF